jgi:SAM-dependent methyltransferase
MCLYLAHADRVVIGADLTRASLRLGAEAARRFGLERVLFIETDLLQPGLAACAFDVVFSSGVLHHTPNPRASFGRLVKLVRPGGIIVLGVYNAVARVPLRLRRVVAQASGFRLIPFDPVLRDRRHDPERREAWLRDQYQPPEEHRHTIVKSSAGLPRTRSSFSGRSSAARRRVDELFVRAEDNWRLRVGWRKWADVHTRARAACSTRLSPTLTIRMALRRVTPRGFSHDPENLAKSPSLDQRQAVLNRQRRGVRPGRRLVIHGALRNPPMMAVAIAWERRPRRLALEPLLHLAPRFRSRDGMPDDKGIGGETDERKQGGPRQPQRHGPVEPIVQPRPRALVLRRRPVGGVEQEVRVQEDHEWCSPRRATTPPRCCRDCRRDRPRSNPRVR